MKKLSASAFLAIGLVTFMTSCTNEVQKKVVIMGRGDIKVEGNKISVSGGSGYVEKAVELREEGAVTWEVNNAGNNSTVNIPAEPGTYILNLKTDTIVGSRQNIGTDLTASRTITQEEIKEKIDSLTQLTMGTNVSLGGSNYFIIPNQLIKITSNKNGRIFGPYTKIPAALDMDADGKEPEIYKFYTNSEMRGLIKNFKEMTF
jgi:hypothetical protein